VNLNDKAHKHHGNSRSSWKEYIDINVNGLCKKDIVLDHFKSRIEYAKFAKDALKSIHIVDTNIDRFTDFCLRVLNKKGYKEYRKTTTMYSIIFLLELVGDDLKKIAIHLIEAKKITPKMEELFRPAYEIIHVFYTLFYNYSNELCLEAYGIDQNKGHYYSTAGKKWVQFKLDGESFKESNWLKENGAASPDIPKSDISIGENYIISYSCKKQNNEWKCGCIHISNLS